MSKSSRSQGLNNNNSVTVRQKLYSLGWTNKSRAQTGMKKTEKQIITNEEKLNQLYETALANPSFVTACKFCIKCNKLSFFLFARKKCHFIGTSLYCPASSSMCKLHLICQHLAVVWIPLQMMSSVYESLLTVNANLDKPKKQPTVRATFLFFPAHGQCFLISLYVYFEGSAKWDACRLWQCLVCAPPHVCICVNNIVASYHTMYRLNCI